MSNFIKFIIEKEKNYSGFKLNKVIYERKSGIVTLYILYPDEFGIITKKDKENFKNFFKLFVGEKGAFLEVETRFKKSYCETYNITNSLNDYLSKKYPVYSNAINFGDLSLEKEQSEYILTLPIDNESISEVKLKNIEYSIKEYLDNEYCYNFILKFNKTYDSEIELEYDDYDENLDIQHLKPNTAKVVKNTQLVGSEFQEDPICVFSVDKPMESAAIVGMVENFEEKEYKRKNGNNETKKFYSFNLSMEGETLRVVYFPRTDKPLELDDYDAVEVIGDVESFNNSLSLKASHIATVDIKERPKDKIVYKSAPNNYRVIFPEDVEVVEQLSLFNKEIVYPNSIMKNAFVVFDLETTGLDHKENEIIEIGAVKVVEGKIVEKFSTFVKPKNLIPDEITKITSITNSMVEDAPSIEEVLPDFYKFCQNTILLAYNIDFDFKFLNNYAKKNKYNFKNKKHDVLILARNKIKGLRNYKLKTVAESLEIDLSNAHRAYYDAIATARIFLELTRTAK